MKKCFDTNADLNIALLEITSVPVGSWLPNPATLLFKRPIKGLILRVYRTPIDYDYDEKQYDALTCKK